MGLHSLKWRCILPYRYQSQELGYQREFLARDLFAACHNMQWSASPRCLTKGHGPGNKGDLEFPLLRTDKFSYPV